MTGHTGSGPAAVEHPRGDGELPTADIGRLLLRCADRPGLVAAVSAFLAGAGANIVSLDQHATSQSGGTFMQRTIFHLPGLAAARDSLVRDFAEQVAGPYEMDFRLTEAAKPKRVAIMASSVVFYNGLKLEGRMADLLSGNVAEGRVHIAMSDALDADMLLGESGHDAIDPHIWMDVSMWKKATQLIQAELVRRLPQHAEIMTQRAEELRTRLSELDRRGLAAMATIPESQRVLISSHDAFQYFGRRYGLRVEGVQGISTASEAGLSRIPELIHMIGERKVPAVFKESSVAGRMIDAIIEGAAARGIHLQVGPELYSDALGATGSGADTYEGMMAHNFQAVAVSLGGRWE